MTRRPTLETDRLILRPFTLDDASDVQQLAGAFEIADTTLNIPHPYEDGMAEAWIGTHAESFASGRDITFAIARKADGTLLGSISLMGIEPDHKAEIGYWVGVPYWGDGICTEAAEAVVRYGIETLGLMRIHAYHITRNPASGRVMQKLGMTHEGHRPQHARRGDQLEDIEMYGLLATDWKLAASSKTASP